MRIDETTAVVARANQLDPRVEVTHDTVDAWHRIIGNLNPTEAARAVDTHYAASTDRIMPSHIRALVNGGPDAGRATRRAYICPTCSGVHGSDPCGSLVRMPDWFRSTSAEFAARRRDRDAALTEA